MTKVLAVEHRLFPWENNPRRGYVGWYPTPEGEEGDHEIPDIGWITRSTEPVEVPSTTYYRRGVRDGDLAEYVEPPPEPPPLDEESSEGEAQEVEASELLEQPEQEV